MGYSTRGETAIMSIVAVTTWIKERKDVVRLELDVSLALQTRINWLCPTQPCGENARAKIDADVCT